METLLKIIHIVKTRVLVSGKAIQRFWGMERMDPVSLGRACCTWTFSGGAVQSGPQEAYYETFCRFQVVRLPPKQAQGICLIHACPAQACSPSHPIHIKKTHSRQ